MPSTRRPSWWLVCAALAGLCGLLLAQTIWIQAVKSITFDETFYLSCGLQTVRDEKLDPRLAEHGVAPLPVLLHYVPALAFFPRMPRPQPWEGQPGDAGLIRYPRRLNSVLTGIPLVLLTFGWLMRRQGIGAATCGTALLVMSPTIIAHVSLATTDACIGLAGTFALLALSQYVLAPTRFRLAAFAFAAAWAMAVKYSALFLVPTLAIAMLHPSMVGRYAGFWKSTRAITLHLLGGTTLFLVAWWGFHQFAWDGPLKAYPLDETPDSSPWVRLLGRGAFAEQIMTLAHEHWRRPAPLAGLWFQILKNQWGHSAFLLGECSQHGWWYYYPCAFLFKSTPSELLLAAILVAGTCVAIWQARGRREKGDGPFRRPFRWAPDAAVWVLSSAALVFVAMVLTAHINIGHRYLVPLYVWLCMISVDRIWSWMASAPRGRTILWGFLLLGQFSSMAGSMPDSLAYFNDLVGGPSNGWKLLADSNIDWGQDLPALTAVLRERGAPPTAIAYFGHAYFPDYGVLADPLPRLPRPASEYRLLAVSATHLQGVYSEGQDPFRPFRTARPVARAGFSIFVFDLDEPGLRDAFERIVTMDP